MSNFVHLYLAIPLARLPEVALQMGEPNPVALRAALAADVPYFGERAQSPAYALTEKVCKALSPRFAAAIPEVPSPFDHITDGSDVFDVIANSEDSPRLSDLFVGVQLHSSYTGDGIPEAKRAASGYGYAITPELLAVVEGLRARLAALAPAFAEAVLVTYEIHW